VLPDPNGLLVDAVLDEADNLLKRASLGLEALHLYRAQHKTDCPCRGCEAYRAYEQAGRS
jgi:hypothetical protein